MMICNFLTYFCICYGIWGVCNHCVTAWISTVSVRSCSGTHTTSVSTTNQSTRSITSYSTKLSSERSSSDDKENEANVSKDPSNNKTTPQPTNWVEEWAMEGAKKIAALNVQERTQRTLLAEMAEDKIYELNIALEKLIDEDTGEILDLDQAKDIAFQTRSLQEQYRLLVTGEPSSMLQAMASLKEGGGNEGK
ncbi:hypothetical protein IV203_022165 [Nitzschia inconspicua]|uniref:No apical meristem-associated C-terminal domain-containing protein n=1 Tax=Nitzschia inconspicua TaxID=303405 RepID=A0A9K3PDY2_9STRA|nr:hypothetical protein IV203_022165 [Nitzschia inconspicua]